MLSHVVKAPALAAGLFVGVTTANVASAEAFSTVASRDNFVTLVQGRELRRFGIRLNVTSDGRIIGNAFGTDVTGEWEWDGGYFCRDIFWGEQDIGFNCQLVQVNGETMRFTSDQGSGQFADLTLR